MKKALLQGLLTSLVATVLVAVSGSSAGAADPPIVVYGFDHEAKGLQYDSRPCYDGGSTPAFDPLYARGGARGSHAIGLGFTEPGGMAGLLATVTSPATLTRATIQALQTEPETNGGAADALFVFNLFAADGAIYSGYTGITFSGTGWITTFDLADVSLDWYQWSGETQVDIPQQGSAAAFATGKGGVATLGVEFGCDGRDHYMDDLVITTSQGTRTYDFEGARTSSYISALPTHTAHELRRGITRLTLVHGQDHVLLGDSKGVADTVLPSGYIDGTARLFRKTYGSSSYTQAGSGGYTDETYAEFHIEPPRQTSYQVRTTPDDPAYENSSSAVLVVTVRRWLSRRVADTRIRAGQRVVVSGRIRPGDSGVPIVLQRRTATGWRAVARTTSGRYGRYVVSARTRVAGTWNVRVLVPTARGNLGTTSRAVEVRVLRRPPATVEDDYSESYIPPVHVVDIKRPLAVRATATDGLVGARRTDATATPAAAPAASSGTVPVRP